MLFILSQRRGEREGSAGYAGLCDLSGLARKDSRKEIISLACCLFSRKGAENAKAAQGIQILATLVAWREKTSREEGSRKGAKGAKECVR